MNIRRFAIVAFVLGAVLAGASWFANVYAQGPQADSGEQAAATRPADTVPEAPSDTQAASQPQEKPPVAAQVKASPSSPAASIRKTQWQTAQVETRKIVLGSLDKMPADGEDGYLFQVELISDGAAINTVKLRQYFATVADKRLAESDIEKYRQACIDDPKTYKGYYSVLNPIRSGSQFTNEDGKVYTQRRELPLATRQITARFAGMPKGLVWQLDTAAWEVEPCPKDASGKTESAAFSWTMHRDGVAVLKLIKTYTISQADYTVDVSLKVVNLTKDQVEITLDQAGPTGVPREDHQSDARRAIYGAIKGEDDPMPEVVPEGRKAKLGDAKLGKRNTAGNSAQTEPVLWVGQDNKFFASMMYLHPVAKDGGEEAGKQLRAPNWKANFYFTDVLENNSSATHMTGIELPSLKIAPSGSKTVQLSLFCGPKRREMFVDADAPYYKPIYTDLDYAGTIQLGGCFCGWDALSLGMIWLLRAISTITFGNFGIAIFVLVIIVRLILHPMTKKSQTSMAEMKKLNPLMKELEKKYADDKEAMNRERMKLYKQHGAGPMLFGCLPMLLQMPILISLYTAVRATIDLRHAAFLPVWIVDMAAPDRLLQWKEALPLIGTEFNLLPVLLGGAMYWQMKLSPQSNQVGATPEQQKQQKMMGFMMPIMMLFIFYRMSSGLTLYFLASTFFGAVESYFIRKNIAAKEALAAAMETTVQMPGKTFRAARPKKPKGPNYFKKG